MDSLLVVKLHPPPPPPIKRRTLDSWYPSTAKIGVKFPEPLPLWAGMLPALIFCRFSVATTGAVSSRMQKYNGLVLSEDTFQNSPSQSSLWLLPLSLSAPLPWQSLCFGGEEGARVITLTSHLLYCMHWECYCMGWELVSKVPFPSNINISHFFFQNNLGTCINRCYFLCGTAGGMFFTPCWYPLWDSVCKMLG